MATITAYSLKRDGDKQLSTNFYVREFRCHDGSDKILICAETVKILQAVRDYFGKPVNINSAYRTESYNKTVGGVSNSQHVKGTACDIRVQDVPPKAVAGFLQANYPKSGIGLYNTFVHIDRRGYESYWKNNGSGNVSVSTFRLGDAYKTYKAKEVVKPTPAPKPTPVQQKGDDEVTQAEFNKMYDTMMAQKAKEQPSNWKDLDKAIAWAKQEGILKGDESGNLMMQKPLTRQEMVLMLYRENQKS